MAYNHTQYCIFSIVYQVIHTFFYHFVSGRGEQLRLHQSSWIVAGGTTKFNVAVPSMRHVSDLKAYRPHWQELPLKLIYTINYEHNPSHHVLCYSCSPPHIWAGPLPATLSIQTASHSAFCSYQHSHTTFSSSP